MKIKTQLKILVIFFLKNLNQILNKFLFIPNLDSNSRHKPCSSKEKMQAEVKNISRDDSTKWEWITESPSDTQLISLLLPLFSSVHTIPFLCVQQFLDLFSKS